MSTSAMSARNEVRQVVPRLIELTETLLYPVIWERPGLSKRDRSLITLGALIAMSRPDQLRVHLERALANGVTPDEIGEIVERVPFPDPIQGLAPGFREFDPRQIVSATRALLERLLRYAPDAEGIVMCGQLHGMGLADERGNAVSNAINWQDQRALQPFPGGGGSYLDEIERRLGAEDRRRLGNEARPGVPLCHLFWLAQNGRLPRERAVVAAIPDFAVASLCGGSPRTDVTHAYGHGALDVETPNWHRAGIERLGLAQIRWPEIVPQGSVVGEVPVGSCRLPIFAPVGDYQCSRIGFQGKHAGAPIYFRNIRIRDFD